MKPTSPTSKTPRQTKTKGSIKGSRMTGEQQVLAYLKEIGARPMTRAEMRRLAASGNLGVPSE